jgi:hypothetical protein
MHLRRFHLYLLGALLLTVVGPVVFSRPGGQRGKGGRPDRTAVHLMVWNLFAKGKDSIDVNAMQFPEGMQFLGDRMRQSWSDFLQKKGITNGVMTRELYLEHARDGPRALLGGVGGRPKGGSQGGPPPPRPEDPKEPAPRIEGARAGQPGGAVVLPDKSHPAREGENRPAVYRVGKLPKGLPPWFAQLDKDNDGQVGLYEWKAAGKATTEFLSMDANGDGFLTAEEVLRFLKVHKKPARPGAGAPADTGN